MRLGASKFLKFMRTQGQEGQGKSQMLLVRDHSGRQRVLSQLLLLWSLPISPHYHNTAAISGKTDAAFGDFKERMCVFH